jgi:nitroimidazol reductase NimA-like FMN-containing flavoprotein (pyridoxamine 5'-phosphate oxidase superfamily)
MPSEQQRTRVRRKPERAAYDFATVAAILDEALYAHVGVVRDGAPVVIPMLHARLDDQLYLHASPAAGLARDTRDEPELCVTATLVDGVVFARSARNHSLNYRSAVVFGRARRVVDDTEKRRALERFVEHVAPGRWTLLRPMTEHDVREVDVLALGLSEASAKVRTGPPLDPDADRELPIWAGVLPLGLVPTAPPVAAAGVPADLVPPAHVAAWSRGAVQSDGLLARPS